MSISNYLTYPFDPQTIRRKKKAMLRELSQDSAMVEKRIAILGGSSTAEIRDALELFLLKGGVKPRFYESAYDRYYEELMFENPELKTFRPDIIYLHTTNLNLSRYPSPDDSPEDVDRLFKYEIDRFESMWKQAADNFGCAVIQNNMEPPLERPLGNLDTVDIRGRGEFVRRINQHFSERARKTSYLHINDIDYLASWIGLSKWHDRRLWYTAKYAVSFDAMYHLANNLASLIRSICGLSRKCLVLDLDNTLWGGVIGDDGLDGIRLGRDTAEGEAFSDFQQYVSQLKQRGVILAVCSKNDEANAKQGFAHPDSILGIDDFSAFKANWDRKDQNIEAIAADLGIGVDSLVFVDDNQAERELVGAQLPSVGVPDIGADVACFIDVLDKAGYFETVSLSQEDVQRTAYYRSNALRNQVERRFANYEEFLGSLEMSAEIRPFEEMYVKRITQLTNKTNQFNLTTKRYTDSEIEKIRTGSAYLTLYGRLRDKFGDNGIVSLIIGRIDDDTVTIDVWLMSCRVLKRGMEHAMFDSLVREASARGAKYLAGSYIRTAKNDMVSRHFESLGFECVSPEGDGVSSWKLAISADTPRANHIIDVADQPVTLKIRHRENLLTMPVVKVTK